MVALATFSGFWSSKNSAAMQQITKMDNPSCLFCFEFYTRIVCIFLFLITKFWALNCIKDSKTF